MIEINTARMVKKPWSHQLTGTRQLLKSPVFGLYDEPGAGKTKQVVDAACILYEAGLIDIVLIACPAQVKDVWTDTDLGEVKAHCFVEYIVRDFCRKTEEHDDFGLSKRLWFVVGSYEFFRQQDEDGGFPKVDLLLRQIAGRKVWLVLDEVSNLGDHKSLQTKAMMKLRGIKAQQKALPIIAPGHPVLRVTELDGTPAGNSPMDLYSKAMLLSPQVLKYQNFFHFRANHAIMGGFKNKQIVGFRNLDKITTAIAPYCIRRLKKDCMDLPEKLPPTFMTAQLGEKTWSIYKQLRDDMIAEFNDEMMIVQHAAVKVLRLAQVCAGFLGGFENEITGETETRTLSAEATNLMLAWLKKRLADDPNFKTVIWCRWRPEIDRLIALLQENRIFYGSICGGMKLNADHLHPESEYRGPFVLVAQPQAAQYGLNFAKASCNLWLSRDYNLVTRQQADERIHRGGQVNHVEDISVLVTGPQGQKTVTFDIYKALTTKEDIARRTTDQWRRVIREGV